MFFVGGHCEVLLMVVERLRPTLKGFLILLHPSYGFKVGCFLGAIVVLAWFRSQTWFVSVVLPIGLSLETP